MKRIFGAVKLLFCNHWRGLLIFIIVAVLAVLALSFKFDSLVPGQNQFETDALTAIDQPSKPWTRAVNAPYNLTAHYIGDAIDNQLLGTRITSVIICLFATIFFFYILKMWFTTRIATIGSLLFITSSWLLNISHQGAYFSLLVLGPLLILTPLFWYLKTKKHSLLAFLLFTVGIAIAAYIPYMPLLAAIVLTVMILKEKPRLAKLKTLHIVIAAVIYFLLLAPLFMSLLSHPGQIKELLGIPVEIVSLKQYFINLSYSVSMVFAFSPVQPELHLGNLPMLNFFDTAMFIIGIYYFINRFNSKKSLIIFGAIIMFLLLLPLSPIYQMNAAVLLPFIYILVLAGIIELLNLWFSFFPRNPWARSLGIALIVVAIGFSCFYHLHRYYVAWPSTPETKAAYMLKSN